MEQTDIIYRFLKSREYVDKNAGVLAEVIINGRNVDAVVLESNDYKTAKNLLENYSDITYGIIEVNGNILLLYPEEERDKYMNLRDMIILGGDIAEFSRFSYSEAKALTDYLKEGNIDYIISSNAKRISIIVSRQDKDDVNDAINHVIDELRTEEGQKYFTAINMCFKHAINCAVTGFSYNGPVFIGREGGSGGVKLDKDIAILIPPKGKCKMISKYDRHFEDTVINFILNDLNGLETPVKQFFGDFADLITEDITNGNYDSMPASEAAKILGVNGVPSIEQVASLLQEHESEYKRNEQKNHAIHTLMRMSACRSLKIEDIKDIGLKKEDKKAYKCLHEKNIRAFTGHDIKDKERGSNER